MSWHSINSLSRILPTVHFSMHFRWGTHYTWGKLTFYPGFVEWYSVPGFDKKNLTFNPFALEPPVTARADPCPCYHLWHHQFERSMITSATNLCRVKRSFKPYQNEHNSVKDTGEKGKKKTCNIDLKISMKIMFHYTHLLFLSPNPKIIKAFLKTFPSKRNKRGKKSEKRGQERKWKVKVETAVLLLNPSNFTS